MTEPHVNGHAIPRDLTHYEPTQHFMERLKYRADPAPTEAIVGECVREGEVKNTHHPERVIFERDIGWHTWRVLAAINPDAFDTAEAYHHLLTVYAAGVHDADHREVFDMERETV